MRLAVLVLSLLLCSPAWATVNVVRFPSGTPVQVCQPSDTNTNCGGGGSSGLTIGTTPIASGTNTYLEYNNNGKLGEIPQSTFLLSGGTAANSAELGGQLPSYYLHSYSETDPVFSTWQSSYDHHANWDTAYGWGNPSGVYLPLAGGTLTGDLALTTHNITMTGSLGATGAGKLLKGWFTDLEITNLPTINGGTLATALGLGSAAYTASTAYDVAGAASAVTPTTLGLVIGTNTQAHGAKLDSIQALASAAGWLHNDGSGGFGYSTPTYSQVGADVAGAAAAITLAGLGGTTLAAAEAAITPTELGLVIGTNVLAQRTFGTAANNNTGDFLASGGTAANSSELNGQAASYYQTSLSLLKGTLTDTDLCTYTASGTLLNCNTAASGLAVSSASTATTATNLSTNGTANQVWGMNAGASAQGWQTATGGGMSIGGAVSGGSASQLLATDGSTNLQNLAVATYPSLTEVSYVKGVTSSIQTQFTGKAATNQTMYIGTTSNAINRSSASEALTGITSIDGTAVNLSGTPALPNGTTATTQSQADGSTKLATTAYVDTGLGGKQATGSYLTGVTADSPLSGSGTSGSHLVISTAGTWAGNAATATTATSATSATSAANLSGTPALPNGTTATTQSAGDNSTKLATTAYVNNIPYIKVSETQTSGTNGGIATTGSWITSVLNTKDSDTASIASLTNNQITLPAGTYLVRAQSPFFTTSYSQIRLQNITAGTTLLVGTSTLTQAGSTQTQTYSMVSGIITLSTTSAVAVQYQVSSSNGSTTAALGVAASFGTEVYTVVEFTKIS